MNPAVPIPSTLTLATASGTAWDVIVVGAGCAGALAAREVARRGRSVLLVDKASFPRWKVCGCSINARAQAALRSAGLGDLLGSNGAVPLDTFRVAAQGRVASLPLPGYVALSREVLDSALVRAAIESGANFLPQTQAQLDRVSADYRTVRLRQGAEEVIASARLVLAADGLGGRLLRSTDTFESTVSEGSRIGAGAVSDNAPAYYAPGIIFMACGAGGYVGLVRVEGGRLDIGAAFDTAFVRESGGLPAAASRVLAEAGFPAIPQIGRIPWRGTPALTRTASLLSAHRALVLGDAAGYLEPFTGEGMSWAFTSAVAIADLASRAVDRFDSSIQEEWARIYRRIVTRRQVPCRILAAALRRPSLVRRTIALVSWAPNLASPVVRHVNAPLKADQGVQQL